MTGNTCMAFNSLKFSILFELEATTLFTGMTACKIMSHGSEKITDKVDEMRKCKNQAVPLTEKLFIRHSAQKTRN